MMPRQELRHERLAMRSNSPICQELEPRRLLSAAALSTNSFADAVRTHTLTQEQMTNNGVVEIEYQGQTYYAKANEWVVFLDTPSTGAGMKQPVAAGPATPLSKDLDEQLRSLGIAVEFVRYLGSTDTFLVKVDPKLTPEQIVQGLAKLPDFISSDPNTLGSLNGTVPNDLGPGTITWGQAKIQMHYAWDLTQGSPEVVVGVTDSGIDYTHEDLSSSMWQNVAELYGTSGVDDDGNGYIDDVFGFDFGSGDSDPMDAGSHGTHVAGTIGATTNNGIGVPGVAWNVKMMALKITDQNSVPSFASATEATQYATLMRQRGTNIVATNNSYAVLPSFGFETRIRESGDAGILFVAAAGNNHVEVSLAGPYPAAYSMSLYGMANVVTVAATDQNDALATFSNWGTDAVDLAAPGVDVISTVPGNQYGSGNGTSMAAPHVTGVAALIASIKPNASYLEIKNAILNNVDPVSTLSTKVATGGRLNAYKALLSIQNTFGRELILEGTDSGETLYVRRDPLDSNYVETLVNGVRQDRVLFSGLRLISIKGRGGNDNIIVEGTVNLPVNIDAGDGNDNVEVQVGNTSRCIIYGGNGNDTLTGGNGDDVIYGGTGADLVSGRGGLSFGGATSRPESAARSKDSAITSCAHG